MFDYSLGNWIIGLFIGLVLGGVVSWALVDLLRWLGRVSITRPLGPCAVVSREFWFTNLGGAIERLVFLIVATADYKGAAALALPWLALKMASSWNRQGRVDAYKKAEDVPEHEHWARITRGALSGLIGGLVSIAFAIIAGLYIQGKLF